MAVKSLFVTYLLWLLGGFIGLHHFYLGRDRHALVWLLFAGGYFGIGWLRDLWRIPEYVRDSNGENNYIEHLAIKMRKYPIPPSSTVRYCGQVLVADAFGYLTLAALPKDYIPEHLLPLAAIFTPLFVAIGIHLVGNIGREEGAFKLPLIGAYATYPLYFWNINSVFWTSLVSAVCFNNFSKRWRRTPRPSKSLIYRISILLLCVALYASLWCSWLYFNCTITSQDGEEIMCRDAARHFFTSPIWKEFLSVIKDIYHFAKYHGWKEVWHQLIKAFDPSGEANSLKVLGLDSSATQQEITARYRKLSRQWHPDKHQSAEDKQLAQEKFIEIQEAYGIISHIKSQRVAQNVKAAEGGQEGASKSASE